MKRFFYTLFLVFFFLTNSFAVAPLPGLGLKEPYRARAPFTLQAHDAKTNRQSLAPHKAPIVNLAPRGLLILVNFSDVQFAENNTIQAFDSLANADHYTYNGAYGSCKQYFTDQSNGKYIPHFDVVGPVTLPQTMQYYGANDKEGNDQYVVDFVIDACCGADQLGVNFADYDNDNDGILDFVYIIYAGYAESEGGGANSIWPHNWDLVAALYYGYTNQKEYYANSETDYHLPEIDGKQIYTYACSNELRYRTNARTGIGTICHEFSHVLGLPDYYLTMPDAQVAERETPGAWSLMGYGNYLNNGNTPPNYSVYDKYYLGWIEPEVLAKTQSVELPADGLASYMLARNEKHVAEGAYRTDTVYYIENRQQTGWDTYLPGHGMLVWRVVFDEEDWYYNCPNDYVARYRLISAETKSSPFTEDRPKPEVPFPGKSQVTQFAPFQHNRLENIQESEDGIITFDFVTESKTPVDNITVSPHNGVWYNILGQPINPQTYKGIAIQNGKKYLLR